MLEFDFHGGSQVTSLNYVVGYLKTYYEKKIGLGPKPVGSTLRFLGPTFRAGTGYFEKFKIVRTQASYPSFESY